MTGALVRYDQARQALAECVRVDDVKSIRDKAMAMQVYAQQANDRIMIDQATEIRLRAEIRAGELLAEMKVRGERQKAGDNPKGRKSNTSNPPALTLADLGISYTQSSRWQQLAALPRAEQEAVIGGAKSKAVQAVQRARAKSKAKPPPTYDDDDGVSRAAVRIALDMREAVAKALDKLPATDLPGLLVALRDEWSAVALTIRRRIKEISNGHRTKRKSAAVTAGRTDRLRSADR